MKCGNISLRPHIVRIWACALILIWFLNALNVHTSIDRNNRGNFYGAPVTLTSDSGRILPQGKWYNLSKADDNDGWLSGHNKYREGDDEIDFQKQIVYVVSLQGVEGASHANNGRFDSFVLAWERMCGYNKFDIRLCPGKMDKRRGYGLQAAFTECFDRAIEDNQDINFFFEDDARLFSTEFCNIQNVRSLWNNAPQDAYLIMLGGHTFTYGDASIDGYLESHHSYGSYAFSLKRENLFSLRVYFSHDLRSGEVFERDKKNNTAMISPDLRWYNHAAYENMRVYVTFPLVVYHEEGYSNTWKKNRGAIKEGGIADYKEK